MSRIAHSLTLASLVAVLSATPTIAISGSTDCRPSDRAELRAYFHRAEFNVVDEMSVYHRDLSAYGTPRPASAVSQKAPAAKLSNDETATSHPARSKLDLASLRTYFHSGAFNASDGLVAYGGE